MPRIRLAVTVLVAGAVLAAAPLSAARARALPVNYDFATGAPGALVLAVAVD